MLEEFLAVAVDSALPPELRAQISAGLKRRYEAPPIESISASMGSDAITVERARTILFSPSESDMALYPRLLAGNESIAADDKDPKFKALIASLTGLYLVHHRKWTLMRPFIASGGLSALITLIDKHPMLQVVSQALHVFLLCTDEELFPWHEPPLLPDGSGPKEGKGPDASTWNAMHELSKTSFIKILFKHATPSSFPEGSHLVLKIIAFYLSWLRKHYTASGILHISAELINSFKNWGSQAINKDESMGCPPPSEEELQLAQKLYDDFSRFPPAEDSLYFPASQPQDVQTIEGKETKEESPLEAFLVESLNIKQQADVAFREKKLSQAIDLYSHCLDMMVPSEALSSEGTRRSVLHANRAASYLARAVALMNDEGLGFDSCDSRGLMEGIDLSSQEDKGSRIKRHYEAALMDSQTAIDLNPTYSKAWMRKVICLSELQRDAEALETALHGRSVLSGVLAKDIDELIDKIRARLHPPEASNELEEMD